MPGVVDRARIVCLVNNAPKYDSYLLGCFGLSFWIETTTAGDRHTLLFDVGPLAEPLFHNAGKLGLRLDEVEAIVLSHNHFDHTEALPEVVAAIGHPVTIYAHPAIGRPSFVLEPQYMNYGMVDPRRRAAVEAAGGRFVLSGEPVEIAPGVLTTGEIEQSAGFEATGGVSCYTLDADGKVLPDRLQDDMSLVLNLRERGLVVMTGCAHAGVVNSIRHALRITGASRLEGVVGGFHLLEAGQARVDQTIEALQAFGPAWVAPMHCTGIVPTAKIAMAFPGRFRDIAAGDVIELPG